MRNVAFVYFAGHGIEANGANWLIPTDADPAEDRDLDYEAIKADLALQALQGARMRVLVLDSCRDNPFGRNWRASVRSTTSGLAKLEADDVLVLFAAAPGRTARDGAGLNSPFAEALAKRLPEPCVPIQLLGGNVRDDVLLATGGTQRPYVSASITGKPFYLVRPEQATHVEQPIAAPITQQKSSEAAEAWDRTKDTTSIAALELFIATYKGMYYAGLALLRLEELKNKVAMATPPAPPPAAKEQPPTKVPARPLPQAARPSAPLPPAGKETHPAAVVTPTRCDGVEITVGQNEKRCFKPGAGKTEHFNDCPTCPEMVVAPAGSFTMGSPMSELERYNDEDQVHVTIGKPFAVFDEWDACVSNDGCNGYRPADQGWSRGKHPVINVSWDAAKAYASWLSRRTGKSYRLLSEAEREYVTRAGTTTPLWWGSSITPKQANYDGSVDPYKGGGSKGEYRQRTVPVDSFEPNPWGLYQVNGNVYDWTEDCWNTTNTGNPGDGRARTTGDCTDRVLRGVSWLDGPRGLRSANRNQQRANDSNKYTGFRVARTLAP